MLMSFFNAGRTVNYSQKMTEQEQAAQMWSCNRMKVAEEVLRSDVNFMMKITEASNLINVPVKAIIWTVCFVGKYPNLRKETVIGAGRFNAKSTQEWADMVENMVDNENPEIHKRLPLRLIQTAKGERICLNYDVIKYPDSLAKKMANCHFPEPVLQGHLNFIKRNYENGWGVENSREGSMLGRCRHKLDICLDVINWENAVAYRVTDKWSKMPILFKNNVINGVDDEGRYIIDVIPTPKMEPEDVENVKFTQEAYREMARMLMSKYNGQVIHLPKSADYRGRLYSRGYYMNDQGIDHSKASLVFANGQKELGTMPNMSFSDGRAIEFFSDEDWIWFEFANQLGLDKLSGRDRINFVKMLVPDADAIQPLMDMIAVGDYPADKPCMALAALDQIGDMFDGNEVVWGVSQDACASGLQLAAAMLLDWRLAAMTNLVQPKRLDTYTELFEAMKERLLATSSKKYERTILKKAFMPFIYASDKSLKDTFEADVSVVTQVLEKEVPGLMYWHDLPQDLWKNVPEYRWIMPDGFNVVMPVFRQDKEIVTFFGEPLEIPVTVKGGKDKGKALGPNWIHSCDALVRRELDRASHLAPRKPLLLDLVKHCPLSDKPVYKKGSSWKQIKLNQLLAMGQKTGYYSLRILEFINSKEQAEQVPFRVMVKLINLLAPEEFEIICVHDCFRVLPKYCNFVKWFYLETLANLAESEVLCHIIRQTIKNPKFVLQIFSADRKEFADEIRMKGNYAIS